MNLSKRLPGIIALLIMHLAAAAPATAQEPLSAAQAQKTAKDLVKNYSDWGTVAIDGKIESDRLPISPSVKIFMKRNKVITISVRAPFLGEVGRAKIWGDSVMGVNKLKKTYFKEKLGDFVTDLPVTLGDLQNLLLGRPFVAGSGVLSANNCSRCDYYDTDEGLLIVPKESVGSSVRYGFVVDSLGRLLQAIAEADGIDAVADATYEYSGTKTYIDMNVSYSRKEYDARLKISKTQFGAKPLEEIDLSKRYTKVSPAAFIKSVL